MSDHITTFIPMDPHFVPTMEAQRAATAILREIAPLADAVEGVVEEAVVFRDCGENFERVLCPHCHAAIPLETWQNWMSDDFTEAAGFRLSPILPSCCRTSTTLNKLLYDWPQGFSRYRLSAMNVGATVTDEAVRTLEVALGCELRTIRHMI